MGNFQLEETKKLYKHFKEVSIAEFFERNRHLLGFDNPKKALLMTVKELVDNSLDACEEARILPEVKITIKEVKKERYIVRVEDNGPGIPKEHIPNVFGKFLYGSKFHRFIATRGRQGIGVSALTLYSQLTIGKPIKVISKTPNSNAYYFEIKIDTKRNEPKVLKFEERKWKKKSGTVVEVEIEGRYSKGKASVDEYINLTALVNPHAKIVYINPRGEKFVYNRITNEIPELKEIKPHPHGIELGVLARMLKETKEDSLLKFLIKEFSSVGKVAALNIIKKVNLDPNRKPQSLKDEEIERLYDAMLNTKIRAPPSKVLITLGEEKIAESLINMYNPEFVSVKKRPPSTYRGLPFIVEVGIAYGNINTQKAQILRFANRVPLLYRSGECAITQAVKEVNWKSYGLKVGDDNIPQEPMIIFVHISSVWIPFTSESKEAIAQYPEIIREIKLALRDAAKNLYTYIRKKRMLSEIEEKYITLYGYSIEISESLSKILNIDENIVRRNISERIKKELKKDLIKIVNTIREIKTLVESGKINEAKRFLKNLVKKLIEKGIIDEKELENIIKVLIPQTIKNYGSTRKNKETS